MAIKPEETAKKGIVGQQQMMCGPANGQIPTTEEKIQQYEEALKIQQAQTEQAENDENKPTAAAGEQQANGDRTREDETKKDVARHENVDNAEDKRINTNEALENRKGDVQSDDSGAEAGVQKDKQSQELSKEGRNAQAQKSVSNDPRDARSVVQGQSQSQSDQSKAGKDQGRVDPFSNKGSSQLKNRP